MPRSARVKDTSGIYHVMVRSISEINLFINNQDKDRYLSIISKYQKIYKFKIYAFCLMSNHGHFLIDCSGCDISKFMQSINLSYSLYFNKKYNRHGHLFQDRFKSRLIENDRDLIATSVYIHNNPKDIKKYSTNPYNYFYSSMGCYIKIKSLHKIEIDTNFILEIISSNSKLAIIQYLQIVNKDFSECSNKYTFKSEKSQYRSEKAIIDRNIDVNLIIKFLQKYFPQNYNISIKRNSEVKEYKAILFTLLRSFSSYKLKDICNLAGNLTLSSVSKTYLYGIDLIHSNPKYKNIVENFILSCS